MDVTARYATIVWGLEKKPVISVRTVNHPGRRVTGAIWWGTNALVGWAWKHCEGNRAEIEVYADAYAVELFLNGKSLGKKRIRALKPSSRKTRYITGTLRAVAYDRNRYSLGESEVNFATGILRIAIIPEESQIQEVHLIIKNCVVESNDN
ncbi:DUF4982 domain-containing protein [Anaerolinea thermolimosa]|uniref:DUF4982 domain-containing protein n=1 Tax=Anaerolinea thermolimosa TaxID=229919 RepID=UPI0013B3C1AA|nr:DUF4982 domain-containing protein [Anaerolinea thermolimosa]